MLPASYLVSFSFEKDGDIANASGGFSDVWKVQNQQGVAFALKDFRVNKQNDLPKLKKVRSSLCVRRSPVPDVTSRGSAKK